MSVSPVTVRRAGFVLAVLAAVGLAGSKYADKLTKPGRTGQQTRSAFLRWREQVLALDAGTDVYRRFNYPNPPVMALVLRPFYRLEPTPGALAWFGLKAVLAGVTLFWAVRLARGPTPTPDWAVALAVLFSLHPVLGDLSHGNVNILIAFLLVAALDLLRRRWDFAAGLVLALAIACKVTPALFLPYLAWKRWWTALGGALVGLGLWLVVVPGAALGFDRNAALLGSWFDTMVRPFVVEGRITSEHANQSLPGLFTRLLTDSPSSLRYDEEDGRPVPDGQHNLLSLDPAAVKWLIRGGQLGFVVAVVVLCRTPRDCRQGVGVAAEYALVALGMLLFSERTWKHHAVTLVVPYAVIAAAVAARPWSSGVRAYLTGTMVAVGVLALGPSVVGGEFQDTALTYGSHTAVFLLLTAAVGVVLWGERRPRGATSPLATDASPPTMAPRGAATQPK